MRSSVSAILSDPAPDTTMSFPDYSQSSADHATLLVLCQHIGHQMDRQTFMEVVDTISQVRQVRLTDKNGGVRSVRVRYTDTYPTENNEWGEFQAHRRVLGVVTVGKCHNQVELAELCRLHESCRAKYHSTVYDTRCVVLSDTSHHQEETVNGDGDVCKENINEDDELEKSDKSPHWFLKHSHKTRLLQYQDNNYQSSLSADIEDFVNSLFWILESKRVEATRDNSDRLPLLCAPFERKDFVGLDMESRNNRKRVLGRLKKHLGDLSLQAGKLAEAWNYYQVAADVLRPANDWLWLAASLEGLCAVSVCLQEQQSLGSRGLADHEIVEKYREAVIHYGKYKHAGIIETEASIKAVMVLIKQGNFLLAAEFLQNIVFINLQMNDAEKIARFLALSDLYSQIGFQRKSAFYKRVAAMRCVAPQNPSHDWRSCYHLMLAAVPGYSLDLTSSSSPGHGWPALQVQLLQELVGTSRKMGSHSASTRHMTFLLQNMFPVLSDSERQDFSGQLSVLSSRAGASPDPLSLESSGLTLPPVPLTCLPMVAKLSPQQLQPHLLPQPRKAASVTAGPFLFTPIQSFGGGSARSSGRVKQQQVNWVTGEAGEVLVVLTNPLLVELTVSQLSLVTEGVPVEVTPPSSLTLPPSSTVSCGLAVTARQPGQLRLLGYTHTVLGVQSKCLLAPADIHTITVIPPLPLLTSVLEQRQANSWTPVTTNITVYSGELQTFRLTLKNVGQEEVTELVVDWNLGEATGSTQPQVTIKSEEVESRLPLAPGASLTVILEVKGVVDLMASVATLKQDDDNLSSASDSRWSFSLPSSSFRSSLTTAPTTPGHPSLVSCTSAGSAASMMVEVVSVTLQYSGLHQTHCRKCVQQLNILQLPSVLVTRWDVLPGDTQHNCFLVLDLVNKTNIELELQYTEKKTLLIEAGDMCRVPVPVTKCSFSESLDWAGGDGVVDYLGQSVSLAWSVLTQDSDGEEVTRRGLASLDNITWTDNMLDLIRRPPLVARLTVNNEEVVEGGELELVVGEVISVTIVLTNQLLEPVCDCCVVVRLEQDSLGRAGLGAGAGTAGAPGRGDVGEVMPGQEMSHTTTLLPLTPGNFKLGVSSQVRFRDKPHSWRLAPVIVNIKI